MRAISSGVPPICGRCNPIFIANVSTQRLAMRSEIKSSADGAAEGDYQVLDNEANRAIGIAAVDEPEDNQVGRNPEGVNHRERQYPSLHLPDTPGVGEKHQPEDRAQYGIGREA